MYLTNQNPKIKSAGDSRRGSALLTAVIFSFVIGALAVTFLKLATSEHRAAVRSTLYSSSLNLAESGIEMGVIALSNDSEENATLVVADDYLTDKGFSGDIHYVVFTQNQNSLSPPISASDINPVIVADGILQGHPAGDVKKQVKVKLKTGIYPFSKGFSSRNGIVFKGNGVYMDSYNSNFGAYGAELDFTDLNIPEGYGSNPPDDGINGNVNINDDIFVASDIIGAVGEDAVTQGNADIYGYVSLGPDSTISIGPNGSVTSYDGDTDDRIYNDFYADFPVYESENSPSGTISAVSGFTVIEGSSDPSNPLVYDLESIGLNGSGKDLVISGHVELQTTGDITVGTGVYILNGDAPIDIDGDGVITIAEKNVAITTMLGEDAYAALDSGAVTSAADIKTDSSLVIYSSGDIDIGGTGVANAQGTPLDFQIFGTADTTVSPSGELQAGQTIKISGNGQLYSSVYAPNADVELKGGGDSGEVLGGMVAFTATITGGSVFHFDEALRGIIYSEGQYTVESWLEMNGATAASTPIDLSVY